MQESPKAYILTAGDWIGLGTLSRMRDLMVQRAKDASRVFRNSADQVRQDLLSLQQETSESLGEIIDEAVSDMRHNYYTVIIEPQVRKFSEEQIQIRNNVHRTTKGIQAELQLGRFLRMKETARHGAASEALVKAEPTEAEETRELQAVEVTIKRELADWDAQA